MRSEMSWKIGQMVLGFEHAFTSVGIQECKSHTNKFSLWELGIMLDASNFWSKVWGTKFYPK